MEERFRVDFRSLKEAHWNRMVRDVKMDMKLKDARTRVWQLVLDYKETLEEHGYHSVLDECP